MVYILDFFRAQHEPTLYLLSTPRYIRVRTRALDKGYISRIAEEGGGGVVGELTTVYCFAWHKKWYSSLPAARKHMFRPTTEQSYITIVDANICFVAPLLYVYAGTENARDPPAVRCDITTLLVSTLSFFLGRHEMRHKHNVCQAPARSW